MKRFLLFGFDSHFPKGGINDFLGDFDSIEEAHTAFLNHGERVIVTQFEHFQIYDTEERRLVLTSQKTKTTDRSYLEDSG